MAEDRGRHSATAVSGARVKSSNRQLVAPADSVVKVCRLPAPQLAMTCVAVVGWRGVRRLPVQYVRYTSLCPWSSCDSCARRAGSSRVGLPMSEVGKDARRSLKIKTGSVTRLHKELRMYEAEVLTEAEKTERLRSACACPHDIRQQARGLGLQALSGCLPSHAGERAGRVGDDDPRLPAPAGACAGRPAGRAGASARAPARLSASSVCARRRSWARARA